MEKELFALENVWNETIEKNSKPLEPRSRIYASEIGGSMIDRYLKMKAVPYTNPPNSRSMRKFMAGDIWEWIVQTVLVRAGIEFTTQERVLLEYPGLLPISGRIDFIITGNQDFANIQIDETMPEFMQNLTQSIKENFAGKNFDKRILEIKSVGSFVFESILAQDNPKTHHMYQAFVYSKCTGTPADVIYVCRDDVRILQYNVNAVFDELEADVIADITEITKYHTTDTQPEKEKLVIWNENTEKFTKNWKVEYSPYLSMLYTYTPDETGVEKPFERPDEYSEYATKLVAGMNRVIAKMRKLPLIQAELDKITQLLEKTPEDKELLKKQKALTKKLEFTDSNTQWIEKMKEHGYDVHSLKITTGVTDSEDEE